MKISLFSPWGSFEQVVEAANCAEENGFYGCLFGEHHGSPGNERPQLMLLCAAVAARTKTIRVGSSIVLSPLYNPIQLAESASMVDVISKGRLLLVGTTLFDSIEPVVWNMTALAASGKPGALELFRRILVASTSIPGAFPPMLLDVTVDGTLHHEMHVDGAAIAQVFVYPPSLNLNKEGPAAGRERHLYIIRNSRPDPDWTTVKRKTLSMMARAVAKWN